MTTVRRIVNALDEAFPYAWAESWDAVGLRSGDPEALVTGVLLTLDATASAVARAVEIGANVLVTHHPPALGEHATFVPGGPADVMYRAAAGGVSIITCHTNLDRAPNGAGVLLRRLGMDVGEPLEASLMEARLITTYVPAERAEVVRRAMKDAGAGRIGEYKGCSYTSSGIGRFEPGADSTPAVGNGGPTDVPEERIEMTVSIDRESAVLSATRAAHPYEEPLITVQSVMVPRGLARLGRVAELAEEVLLEELVEQVEKVFGCTPRIWGQADWKVSRLATATGSGSSLVGAAMHSGAQALLTGEVRYHDALDAISRGMAIIEAGHDVTEWPLVEVLANAMNTVSGLDPSLVTVEEPSRSWWTP